MSRFTLPARMKVLHWTAAQIPGALGAPSVATDFLTGVDITGTSQGEAIAEMNGWESSPSVIEVPDYVSHLVGNVPGDTTIPESSPLTLMNSRFSWVSPSI